MVIIIISAVLIPVLGLIGYIISTYNSLIKQQQMTREAFSSMDVFLKKRYDLIPMLVSVTKSAKDHEASVLQDIVALRAKGMSGQMSVAALGENEQMLSDKINQLLVLVENYPDIKANTNFQKLHDSLVSIEEDLSKARRYYNATVRHYMTDRTQFPSIFIASAFNFPKADYFSVNDPSERSVPSIQ